MWTPSQPIKELPSDLCCLFREHAEWLYTDLESHKLQIGTAPIERPRFQGHRKRVVLVPNPEWYSELYWAIAHFRRDRSLRALDRIMGLQDRPFRINPFWYDCVYRRLIRDRLTDGYENCGARVPPDDRVREFFRQQN